MNSNLCTAIVERMLVQDRLDSTLTYRIVKIDARSQIAWLFNINDDKSWPFPINISSLQEDLDNEDGRFIINFDDPWAKPTTPTTEDCLSIQRHNDRWNLIEKLIADDNEHLILFKKSRMILIKDILTKFKSSRQTITKLIKLYWQRGMSFAALSTDYKNCGKRFDGQPRELGEKKVGAPRTISSGTGINVTSEIRRKLQVAADYYFSHKKATLQNAHDKLISLYFSKKIKNDENKIVAVSVEEDAKPTLRQLQYFIKSNYSKKYIKIRRNGQKNWDLNEREILSTVDNDVQGPGDRFQIDATIADVYLRSQFDRRRIVGRPVIYFVIDVFSRLITGVYVGFEGPSWVGAMMALINMVTPKIEFCRQYGVDITEEDWPAHVAPKRLLADRAELMSVNLGQNIVKNLRINIENTSPGRPDLKSLVERRFGIVPSIFRQFTPGYVEKDFNERGTPDYRLKAIYNLHEFTQLVILAVLEHNMHPIRDLQMHGEMVTEKLTACPRDLWNWGIANRSGLLHSLSVEEVSLQVMPSEKARVTGRGIKFKSGYYSCPTAIRESWFSDARNKEWEVNVSYDPRNLAIVYITNSKKPHWYEKCRLLERSSNYEGKTLFEIEELNNDKKHIEKAGDNKRQEKRIMIDHEMDEIRKNAKKATNAVVDKNTPKSQQTSDIRSNKAEEKMFQREYEYIELGGTSVSHENKSTPNNSASSYPINPLDILKNTRKERDGV